ncbi:MAG TPA: RnfABCDGE type electron transport complex subunit D, partial [Rectinemataceae bacterium]|nr:RnfABCDGE type electron transport complex subunit D [Rectinemataceae bacterium]
MKATRRVLVSGAPFIHGARTAARDAWFVSALLVLVLVWESLLSGWGSLIVAGVAVGTALLAELLQSGLRRRFELDDGSGFLTGLLIALALPPGLPIYVPIVAAAFAILVVKGAFGGLGNNWMNPALGGLAFAWLDWPSQFTTALHSASPLAPLLPNLPHLLVGFDEW